MARLWRPGRQSSGRDNFRTNQVTLAEFQDSHSTGDTAVLGLAAAWACVNLLCGTIASLPLMVYRTNGTAARLRPIIRSIGCFTTARTPIRRPRLLGVRHRLHRAQGQRLQRDRAPQRRLGDRSRCADRAGFRGGQRRNNGALEYEVTRTGASAPFRRSGCCIFAASAGLRLGGLSTLSFGRAGFSGRLWRSKRAASQTFRQGARSVGAFVSDKQLNARADGRSARER
jgi:hypothetical protein